PVALGHRRADPGRNGRAPGAQIRHRAGERVDQLAEIEELDDVRPAQHEHATILPHAMPTAVEQPEGLVYRPDLVTEGEEAALLDGLERLELNEIRLRGVVARRTVRHFGVAYDYGRRAAVAEAEPIPDWLSPVRERAAGLAGVA